MSRPIARVLTLLELLQAGGIRTVAELADRLDVDERTVRRYVDHLIDLDVPVESVRGRYGGYRLASGYRMPPLMLSDDEALAVLLGLVAGRRAGLMTATGTASETAAAKIRRVLPERLGRRLDAVLGSVAFTAPPGEPTAPESAVLLAIADAVRHHRPIWIRYTAADGRRSERTLHPYGLVAHSGRWYVTGADPAVGEERTLRLDRIADARALPGAFEPPAGFDPAERVLTGLATVPYRHEVTVLVRGTAAEIRSRLPAGIAIVAESPSASDRKGDTTPWCRVELRVERLDWLPAVLASLDRPFVIERPDELRDLVVELADRLRRSARESPHRA
ncbi:helix-turn-helix transcriptional regulator [Embleya scabrispora]|uniref:helix-turn-helix transcriptional regulator n=1 Tax=Embleya scabrispora TaxID=159449 RepID=UPI0003774C6F|nr:YafY family protein [Embleya scabrispora]MYS86222.1 WYL domain-containing protein [Streptomyces sp. SID5474]